MFSLDQGNGFSHEAQWCLLQLQKRNRLMEPRSLLGPELSVSSSPKGGLEQKLTRALGHWDKPCGKNGAASPSLDSASVATRVELRLPLGWCRPSSPVKTATTMGGLHNTAFPVWPRAGDGTGATMLIPPKSSAL